MDKSAKEPLKSLPPADQLITLDGLSISRHALEQAEAVFFERERGDSYRAAAEAVKIYKIIVAAVHSKRQE